MSDNFNIVENKLRQFKIRYHLHELYKGIIYFLLTSLIAFVLISVLEYLNYFNTQIRKIIFFGGLIFFLLLFIRFIIIPFLKLLFRKFQIDNLKVNSLIINIIPELKDKLINLIELRKLKNSAYSYDILNASVQQKTSELRPYNLLKAISYKDLKHTGFILAVSISFSLIIFGFNKRIYTESGNRIVHFNETFSRPAPFKFRLTNQELFVKKGEKYVLRLSCEGNDIPQIVYINIGGNNFLMNNKGNNLFEYNIPSVINSFYFHFTDLRYNSDDFFLNVLPKPGINNFQVNVKPPEYTGLSEINLENEGDLEVPSGSKVSWDFSGIDIDSLLIVINDSLYCNSIRNGNHFYSEQQFFKSQTYKVLIKNKLSDFEIALNYNVSLIPDMFPEIIVEKSIDSVHFSKFYFRGIISDDYGFNNLKFHLNYSEKDSSIILPVTKSLKEQEFYYVFDFNDIKEIAKEVSFYFSVSDNDVLNNFKTTTSQSELFRFPEKNEVLAEDKEQFKDISNLIKQSENITNSIKEDLKKLQLDDINNSNTKWEKEQQINEIVNKKNNLERILDQVGQNTEQLNSFLNSFNQQNDEILKKQDEIQKLLDEVFSDELKKLLEEFEKLANEFDSKAFNNLKKKMDYSLEDLSKQLERNLEMLKKMKVQQYIQNLIDDINKLSDNELKISDDFGKEKNYEDILRRDSTNFSQFKITKEQLKDILKLNNELKKPLNFDDFDNEYNEISSDFSETQKDLKERNNRKKVAQNLKNTSEELKNLAFNMTRMLESNISKQRTEDIENLKQILSNLLIFSFSEENLIDKMSNIEINDPVLGECSKMQKQLKEQSIVISDSLYALASRTSQISGLINNELLAVRNNIDKALTEIQEGLVPNARVSQQFIMTAANNLALLLNEALENLEKQMANEQEGNQQCENPNKGGKKGLSLLKKDGDDLKQQLEQMIEQMKKGGGSKMGRQLSEALMQHEMMQKMIREMISNGSVGNSARKQLQDIDNMLEESRRELMNKQINNTTLIRHNQILTRMLEAEKAETERDLDNKRESESAKEEFYSNPLKFFEYKGKAIKSIENSDKDNFRLSDFYNEKLKKYISNLKDGGKL
jgi:hypothetical protein